MYIELTKSVGKIDQESIMNPPPIQSSPLPPNPTPNNNDNDMGGGDEPSNTAVIQTTGRQRFGDTRSMGQFGLDSPILVEYQE